jgi:nitroreductase
MSETSIVMQRFSCRTFTDEPLSRETMERLLEAARWAPSAGNLQPWRFVVVTEGRRRRALAAAALGQRFLADAPVVIVVCAVPEESARLYGDRGRDLYCLQDTAAAASNLLLAATELGLGGCWVGAFDEARTSRILELDPEWRPVALLAVGVPREEPDPRRSRRPLDELVRWVGEAGD